MGALSVALKQEQWEVAAYLLLIALAKLGSQLPPETLAELMALLEAHDSPPGGTAKGLRHQRAS